MHVAPAAGAIVSAGEGFVPNRTLSGKSLGSLEHYSMDWNGADMSEVSTMNAPPKQHPAGPSVLAQRLYAVKLAVNEADKTAAVITFFSFFSDFCKNTY